MSNCESKVACVWPQCECDQDTKPDDVQFLEDFEDLEDEEIEEDDLPDGEVESRSIDRENARAINKQVESR